MSDRERARPASGQRARVARVLVIDHEATTGELVRLVLSDEFEIIRTTNPVRALDGLLSGDWYDVILCDVELQGMRALELHERLLAANPELAARLVFVTAGIVEEDVRAALDGLPNQVLTKPFDFDALRELVRRRTRSEPPRDACRC